MQTSIRLSLAIISAAQKLEGSINLHGLLSESIADRNFVGVVRSIDGLDLESAEPDLGIFNLESDLAAR